MSRSLIKNVTNNLVNDCFNKKKIKKHICQHLLKYLTKLDYARSLSVIIVLNNKYNNITAFNLKSYSITLHQMKIVFNLFSNSCELMKV